MQSEECNSRIHGNDNIQNIDLVSEGEVVNHFSED